MLYYIPKNLDIKAIKFDCGYVYVDNLDNLFKQTTNKNIRIFKIDILYELKSFFSKETLDKYYGIISNLIYDRFSDRYNDPNYRRDITDFLKYLFETDIIFRNKFTTIMINELDTKQDGKDSPYLIFFRECRNELNYIANNIIQRLSDARKRVIGFYNLCIYTSCKIEQDKWLIDNFNVRDVV